MEQPEKSPIHRAARSGDIAEIKALLARDHALVNEPGWMGDTPLHVAAQHGQTEAVRLLIECGAEVNACRTYRITPLHWAASVEVARLLLDAGATLNSTDDSGKTPLHDTVRAGRSDVVRYLLEHGARVDTLSKWDGTPLHAAAKRGDVTSARLLLGAGAEINAIEPTWGTTPLHWAVAANDETIVRFLLGHGAAIEIRNKAGQTAIHYARENRIDHLLDLLRQVAPAMPPKEPAEEDIHVTCIRLHPSRQEAVTTALNGILSRWCLRDGTPYLDFAIQTEHSRFAGLAVSPDGTTVFVAVPGNTIEVRAWDDLHILRTIALPAAPAGSSEPNVSAIALSPDSTWLAVADTIERAYLVDPVSGIASAPVEAGERTHALGFDPASRLLATACSSQGEGHVRIDAVSERGDLTPIHELERSYYQTKSHEFVDTLAHVAFSATGSWLGLFETSRIYHDHRPVGWRGDLVLYAPNSGAMLWQASIDGRATGDSLSLAAADWAMGFFTEVVFLNEEAVLCGSTGGKLLVYRIADGSLAKVIALPTSAASCLLDRDAHGGIWAGLDDGKLLVISEAGITSPDK